METSLFSLIYDLAVGNDVVLVEGSTTVATSRYLINTDPRGAMIVFVERRPNCANTNVNNALARLSVEYVETEV